MIEPDNKYTQMQLNHYNNEAARWSEQNVEPVVGNFHNHNKWVDYENLFTRLHNQSELIGLDFGCGPGRNVVNYKGRFKRLDGVDISPVNIEKAIQYASNNGLDSIFYVCNGTDLDIINDNEYDFVMSTIALQHICVHQIRYSIMKDVYRVLKGGGLFTAQMGYGPKVPRKNSVDYYDNFWDAGKTNGGCDTRVESPSQLEDDLIAIGFKDFEYKILQTGPGDDHPNWIYFSCVK